MTNDIASDRRAVCKCGECGHEFHLKRELFKHLKNHRTENTDIIKRSENNLPFLINSGPKIYTCDLCQRMFSEQRYLNKHSETHIGHCPYKCDVCSITFNNCSELQVHLQNHKCSTSHATDSFKNTTKQKPIRLFKRKSIHLSEEPITSNKRKTPSSRARSCLDTGTSVDTVHGSSIPSASTVRRGISKNSNKRANNSVEPNRSKTDVVKHCANKSFHHKAKTSLNIKKPNLTHTFRETRVLNVHASKSSGKSGTGSAKRKRRKSNVIKTSTIDKRNQECTKNKDSDQLNTDRHKYKCGICEMSFQSMSEMKNHTVVHVKWTRNQKRKNTHI